MNRTARTAAAILLGLAMPAAPAMAQTPDYSAQALADKAEIETLITSYYYNLGRSSADSFGRFYAEDAEMVLGDTVFKGREGIEGAYRGTSDSPQRRAFAFNIVIGNLLVKVNGDTATARLIFTEYLTDKQGDAPRVYVQGREFDHLVKEDGAWKFKRRQIIGGSAVPEDWVG